MFSFIVQFAFIAQLAAVYAEFPGLPASEVSALQNLVDAGLISEASCEDPAITCNTFWRWGDTSRVTALKSDKEYSGDLASLKLEGLPQLRTIKLNPRQITGSIPAWSFTDLRSLTLRGSRRNPGQISGDIPSSLFTSSLVRLNLQYNSITGDIPSTISSSYNLKSLNLRGNDMSGGSLPYEFQLLQNLETLNLRDTGLSVGVCPANTLSNCQLQGTQCIAEGCFQECEHDVLTAACTVVPGPGDETNEDPCSNGEQDANEEGIDCCFSDLEASQCPCTQNRCLDFGSTAKEEVVCETDCSSLPVSDCQIGPQECDNGQCYAGNKAAGVVCHDRAGADGTAAAGVCDGEGSCVLPCESNPCGETYGADFQCESTTCIDNADGSSYTCERAPVEIANTPCYLLGDTAGSPAGVCDTASPGCCTLAGGSETCNGPASRVSASIIDGCNYQDPNENLFFCQVNSFYRKSYGSSCPEGDTDCFCIPDATGSDSCWSNSCNMLFLDQLTPCSTFSATGVCLDNPDPDAVEERECRPNDSEDQCLGRDGATCDAQRSPFSGGLAAGEICPFYNLEAANHVFTPGGFVGLFPQAADASFSALGARSTLNTGNLFCASCNCLSTGVCGEENLCAELVDGAPWLNGDSTPCSSITALPGGPVDPSSPETSLESHECLFQAALVNTNFFNADGFPGTIWSAPNPLTYTGAGKLAGTDWATATRVTSGFCAGTLSPSWEAGVGMTSNLCGDVSSVVPSLSDTPCVGGKTCQNGQCLTGSYSQDASFCDATAGAQECFLGGCRLAPVDRVEKTCSEVKCSEEEPTYCNTGCNVCSCVEVESVLSGASQLYCKVDGSACDCQKDEETRNFPPQQWVNEISKDDYFKVRLTYKGCEDDFPAGYISDSLYDLSGAEANQLAVTCTRCFTNKKGVDRSEVFVYVRDSEANDLTKDDIVAAWRTTKSQAFIVDLNIVAFGASSNNPINNEDLYLGLVVAFFAVLALILVVAFRRQGRAATVQQRKFEELRPDTTELVV